MYFKVFKTIIILYMFFIYTIICCSIAPPFLLIGEVANVELKASFIDYILFIILGGCFLFSIYSKRISKCNNTDKKIKKGVICLYVALIVLLSLSLSWFLKGWNCSDFLVKKANFAQGVGFLGVGGWMLFYSFSTFFNRLREEMIKGINGDKSQLEE